jgi:hypothetical protein
LKLKNRTDLSEPLKIPFDEFANFVFDELWGKHGLAFHDTKDDLEKDIDLLSKLGIVEYDDRMERISVDLEQLKLLQTIAEGMHRDPIRKKIPLVNEYLSRIEQTVV